MIVDAAKRPATIGIVSRPDSVGDLPRAICMYCVRKTVVPNIAMPTATLAITASTTSRSRNRRSGTSGSAPPPASNKPRQERLAPPALPPHGADAQRGAECDQQLGLPRAPGELLPGER